MSPLEFKYNIITHCLVHLILLLPHLLASQFFCWMCWTSNLRSWHRWYWNVEFLCNFTLFDICTFIIESQNVILFFNDRAPNCFLHQPCSKTKTIRDLMVKMMWILNKSSLLEKAIYQSFKYTNLNKCNAFIQC